MKFKYDDLLEKKYSVLFGVIGIIAILINLSVKGFELENILDATKDMASLIVVIIVFLMANRLLGRKKNNDFLSVFEEHLKDWAEQNKYLIDTKSIDNEMGKGLVKKRAYKMVLDHSNFITPKGVVSGLGERDKGAFLYLPPKENMTDRKEEIEFKINSSTFTRQDKYIKDGKPNLKEIIASFSQRINEEFGNINISSTAHGEDRIIISLDKIEHTSESAEKLVQLVEFVKTMILALA